MSKEFLKDVNEYYDVVVIGSGLGGLTSANTLARAGHSVLLLEHHYQLGGMATWFKRKNGHIFDISLHGFPIGMIKSCRKYWTQEISDSIVQKVLSTRQPTIVSDALYDAEFSAARSVMDFKLCSVLCVPLMVRGELLGVIYLGNDNVVNLFTQESLHVATVFAAQAAMVLRNAILIRELQLSNESLTQQIERMNFGSLIGVSRSMREIFKKIDKVAKTDVTVLIEGETGTGKELVAAELHRRSSRKDGPFVVINCGAIPENLLESELFGHIKGAFTGAIATRDGKFQQAHGGSLFLDEVGEMPVSLQAKLLRVLQEKEFERVGGEKTIQVKVRVLATTNRNLMEEVEKGKFREDLYYRLNVFPIVVPPLRDRSDDILLLAETFLKRHARKHGLEKAKFSKPAVNAMRDHIWPGNVRELENAVERAVILTDQGKAIGPELLGLGGVPVTFPSSPDKAVASEESEPAEEIEGILTMEEIEREHILQALKATSGNRTKAAELLAINVRTLRNKIRQYKIDGESVP